MGYPNTGAYLLFVRLESDLEVDRPRPAVLKPGVYLYVGSAMGSLTGRVKRHLTPGKKAHWHIDRVTEKGEIILVVAFPSKERLEERLARFLSERLDYVPGFGSSDLRVPSCLFKVPGDEVPTIVDELVKIVMSIREK